MFVLKLITKDAWIVKMRENIFIRDFDFGVIDVGFIIKKNYEKFHV